VRLRDGVGGGHPRRFYGSWTTHCTPPSGVQAVVGKHADLPGAHHHLVACLELQRFEARAPLSATG